MLFLKVFEPHKCRFFDGVGGRILNTEFTNFNLKRKKKNVYHSVISLPNDPALSYLFNIDGYSIVFAYRQTNLNFAAM